MKSVVANEMIQCLKLVPTTFVEPAPTLPKAKEPEPQEGGAAITALILNEGKVRHHVLQCKYCGIMLPWRSGQWQAPLCLSNLWTTSLYAPWV